MAEQLLLSPEEAFQALSIGRAKGFQMLRSGEIASIKIGRLRRVPLESVRDFVTRQVAEQTRGQDDD